MEDKKIVTKINRIIQKLNQQIFNYKSIKSHLQSKMKDIYTVYAENHLKANEHRIIIQNAKKDLIISSIISGAFLLLAYPLALLFFLGNANLFSVAIMPAVVMASLDAIMGSSFIIGSIVRKHKSKKALNQIISDEKVYTLKNNETLEKCQKEIQELDVKIKNSEDKLRFVEEKLLQEMQKADDPVKFAKENNIKVVIDDEDLTF